MNLNFFPELFQRIRGRAFLSCLLAGLAAAGAAGETALTVGDFADSWRWRDFQSKENGIPDSISVLGFDSMDDIIFAGSAQGIFRYDGFRWTKLFSAETFTTEPITRIVESAGKTLVSTSRELFAVQGGLDLQKIYSSRQFLWSVSPAGGIFIIDLDAREHVQIDQNERTRVDEGPEGILLPGAGIFDYLVDDKRLHWLATSEGVFRRDIRKGFKWQKDSDLSPSLQGYSCRKLFLVKHLPQQKAPLAATSETVRPIYQLWGNFIDPAGNRAAARREENGDWYVLDGAVLDSGFSDLIRDGSGNFYGITENGSLYFSPAGNRWEKVPQIGIGAKKLRSGLVDRIGFIWYAYYYSEGAGEYPPGAGGIVRFDPRSRRWEPVPVDWKQPTPNIYILSLLEASDGSIWAGTENGVYRWQQGKTSEWTQISRTALRGITGLAEDAFGKIWITSANFFPGAYYFNKDTWTYYDKPEISRFPIRRLVPGRRGELWLLSSEKATDGRAFRMFVYKVSPVNYAPATLETIAVSFGPVNDFLQAHDGSYWLATEKGLVHTKLPPSSSGDSGPEAVKASRVWRQLKPGAEDAGETAAPAGSAALPNSADEQVLTEEQGLRSTQVWAVAENPADGSIWVCYPNSGFGVTRIRGNSIDHFDELSGLKSQEVWSISATLSGTRSNIWLGTGRGVVRFDGDCWYHYPVGSLSLNNSRVVTLIPSSSEEDAVLVGTYGHGIYRFRLDDRRRPRFVRSPTFQPARAGSPPVFFWEARDFKDQTPPEELLYRYRIDDGQWSSSGNLKSLSLRGLEPGDHSIQVEVRDQDGNTNHDPAFTQFHLVAPLSPARWRWAWPLIAGGIGSSLAAAAAIILLQVHWRRSIARFRGVFQGIPNPVLIVDKRGKVIDYNGAYPELLGLAHVDASRLAGMPAALVPALQVEEIRQAYSGSLEGELRGGECREPGEAGGRVLSFKTVPIRRTPAGKVQGVVITVEDATVHFQRREDKERQRRMAAVRGLTDRIREELGEILAGIRRDLDAANGGGKVVEKEELEQIKRRTEHAEKLSGALAEFSRSEPPAKTEEVSPSAMIDGILQGGSADALRLPPNIQVDCRSQPGLWLVAIESASVHRSFLEVFQNAIEAMPDGGKITIRLANRRLESSEAELSPGRYVEISIADDGPGISQNQIDRIFDPFYSTKERRRHRGLGLSLAYGAIRRHGGDIRVESRVDAGTRVVVLLPVSRCGSGRGSM